MSPPSLDFIYLKLRDFGLDDISAVRWMTTPNRALDDMTPLEAVQYFQNGEEIVLSLLDDIENGNFSP